MHIFSYSHRCMLHFVFPVSMSVFNIGWHVPFKTHQIPLIALLSCDCLPAVLSYTHSLKCRFKSTLFKLLYLFHSLRVCLDNSVRYDMIVYTVSPPFPLQPKIVNLSVHSSELHAASIPRSFLEDVFTVKQFKSGKTQLYKSPKPKFTANSSFILQQLQGSFSNPLLHQGR